MIELLNKNHQKKKFDCENELLNNYIKKQANQDVKRKLAVCFIFFDVNTNEIQGYYTLSNFSIPLNQFSETIQKKLPKSYNSIPATLLGRLAVDKNSKGKGIGKILLIDALKRCYEVSKEIGSFGVIVDPIDEKAETFYTKYEFMKLPDSKKMFLAASTFKMLFENE